MLKSRVERRWLLTNSNDNSQPQPSVAHFEVESGPQSREVRAEEGRRRVIPAYSLHFPVERPAIPWMDLWLKVWTLKSSQVLPMKCGREIILESRDCQWQCFI